MNDSTVHIRQPEVAALVAKGQFLMVDAHQVQNGRIQIVNMDRVFGDVVRELSLIHI